MSNYTFEDFAYSCEHCQGESVNSDYGVYYCNELDGPCDINKCPHYNE